MLEEGVALFRNTIDLVNYRLLHRARDLWFCPIVELLKLRYPRLLRDEGVGGFAHRARCFNPVPEGCPPAQPSHQLSDVGHDIHSKVPP